MPDYNFLRDPEHDLYQVSEADILTAEQRMNISFPRDLTQLYLEVGYGFIKDQSDNGINRILDPETVADIRLREDVFEFEPNLDDLSDEDKLIFFEVNEGIYISLDLKLENNPVYYFDFQIASSLEDFFRKFINDNEYFLDLLED